MRTHLWIPDTQVRDGVNTDHIEACGNYILEKRPAVVIIAGDWWDMPSLNGHGNEKEREGLRIADDIAAGQRAMVRLWKPLKKWNKQQSSHKHKKWWPEVHFLLGNHEERIERFLGENPKLVGILGYQSLGIESYGIAVHDFLDILPIDGIRYCLTPDHKVLTADLRYVPLGDLKIGDELIGFDEDSPGYGKPRRYRTTSVERHDFDSELVYAVHLSDGKIFQATGEHLWLARNHSTGLKWIRTLDLVPGLTAPCRAFPEWDEVKNYETGWLAGMFDGEGHLSRPNTSQGGIQLGVAQKYGQILSAIESGLDGLGTQYKTYVCGGTNGDVGSVRILGSSGEKLSLLGTIRPERLIRKFKPEMLGRVQNMVNGNVPVVESVNLIGRREIVKIQTSSRTMVVEGYAHHNCHYFKRPKSFYAYSGMMETRLKNIGFSFTQGHDQEFAYGERQLPDGQVHHGLVAGAFYTHDEGYKKHANAHWRGIVMKHEVHDGRYDIMRVSVNFLLRRYL